MTTNATNEELIMDMDYCDHGGRSRAEIERIISERNKGADYERGVADAKALIGDGHGLYEALAHLAILSGSRTWPVQYVVGYQREVLAACGR